jgi:hypothetical protein
MRILSRKDIEMIAERVVTQYKALPRKSQTVRYTMLTLFCLLSAYMGFQ